MYGDDGGKLFHEFFITFRCIPSMFHIILLGVKLLFELFYRILILTFFLLTPHLRLIIRLVCSVVVILIMPASFAGNSLLSVLCFFIELPVELAFVDVPVLLFPIQLFKLVN